MHQMLKLDENSSPSKFHLKKQSMQSSTLSKAFKKKDQLAQTQPIPCKAKTIKKGLKRKLKAPMPWPASALPSQKRTQVTAAAATVNNSSYIPCQSFGQYENYFGMAKKNLTSF